MRSLRSLALLYALGVVLAAPVTLHAEDPQPPPDPASEPAPPAEPAEPAEAPAPAQEPAQPAPAPPPSLTSAPAAPATATPPKEAPTEEPAAKPGAVAAASGAVTIRDFTFNPATVTVSVGNSITWVNADEVRHNAVGDGFSTPLLANGKSSSAKFSKAGSFSYICTVHPQMHGTVKVVASQAGAGGNGGDATADAGSAPAQPGARAADAGAEQSQQAGSGGPQLPSSGLDAWLLAGIGIVLLAAGIAARNGLATR